ncbi:MAG: ATP-binding protein [Anaerolineae bacterium]
MPKSTGRRSDELHILSEAAKALIAPLELPELLQTVLEKIAAAFEPLTFGVVWLWNQSEGVLQIQAACGPAGQPLPQLGQVELHAGETFVGQVYLQAEARLFDTPAAVAEAWDGLPPALTQALGSAERPGSLVAVLIGANHHHFGVLALATHPGGTDFSERDLPLIFALSELIGLAVERARQEAEAVTLREAEQVDRLRAEALATLSHELRTPLAAIKGYSTALLLEEVSWPEEKQHDFLRLIDDECENLQTMIHQVLDSSLIDVGQLALEYQPVRLERLAHEVADQVQRRTDLHRLVLDFPPKFPLIDADPFRLKQVLRNIIDNAIKYSPHGGLVVIRGEVRPASLVVSVADQGVGISTEDLIPLFEKYFRVKSPTGYHIPGTGLGLPVARALVEAHGGRIWAESKVGQGTTLYFSLPRQGLSAELEAE